MAKHLDELRGATRLAIAATTGVTGLVEAMHRTIASGPAVLGSPLSGPARALTGLVYGSVRWVAEQVGGALDAALTQLQPLLGEAGSAPGPEREAVVAALNGVLGDYLAESGNPLALKMHLRSRGVPLALDQASLRAAFPSASPRVLVLLHGSSMSDLGFTRNGHDHGTALARDLGVTPLYLSYNSGLHVSQNGAAFAQLLEQLVAAWPVPVEELALLGHSMGGLVARSACATRTPLKLRKLICLGTPHHGAALERAGSFVDRALGLSRYSAPFARLGKIRSAGVTDLRHGNVRDEDWQGVGRFDHGADRRTPLPLPEGVACYAAAATSDTAELSGDGLVSVDSALGRHADPARTLHFQEQWLGYGLGHLDLLDRPEVYETLRRWLQ